MSNPCCLNRDPDFQHESMPHHFKTLFFVFFLTNNQYCLA